MTKSTNQSFDLASAMKGQQWERCKGELRALVALQGSYHSASPPGQPESYEMARFSEFKAAVSAFIKECDDNGWAE